MFVDYHVLQLSLYSSDNAEQSGEVSQSSPGGIIGPIGWYEALDYIENGSPEQVCITIFCMLF